MIDCHLDYCRVHCSGNRNHMHSREAKCSMSQELLLQSLPAAYAKYFIYFFLFVSVHFAVPCMNLCSFLRLDYAHFK